MKILSFKHSINYENGVFVDASYLVETDEHTFRMLGVKDVSDEDAMLPLFKEEVPFTMEVDEPQMFVVAVTLTPENPAFKAVTFTCHALQYKPE